MKDLIKVLLFIFNLVCLLQVLKTTVNMQYGIQMAISEPLFSQRSNLK